MAIRVRGLIKLLAVLALDATLAYTLLGVEAALLLTGGILLYAVAGEYIDILKDRAVSADKLVAHQRMRLQEAKESLVRDAKNTAGVNISGIRFYMLPDSSNINAYAYGFRCIGITKAALDATDSLTLNAVLGHEIAHILAMDSVFNRLILANMVLLMASMGVWGLLLTAVIWGVLMILAIFNRRCGFLAVAGANAFSRLIKAITSGIQYILVALYRAVMGLLSRSSEFRADAFSAKLGYSTQLAYFLERYVAPQEKSGRVTLSELLYSTHPNTYHRIQRLQQHTQLHLQNFR